jgi:hypothetical protein
MQNGTLINADFMVIFAVFSSMSLSALISAHQRQAASHSCFDPALSEPIA